MPPTVLTGMASGTVILALHVAYQVRRFTRMKAGVQARFPSRQPGHDQAARRDRALAAHG